MLNNVDKLEGQFRLFVKYPTGNVWMQIDDRWKIERIDDKHFRVTPSLNVQAGAEGQLSFHTTNPFIIELGEPKLTIKRNGEE